MIEMAPKSLPRPSDTARAQVFKVEGKQLKRVVVMTGCAQQVLRPAINEATIRLLTRHGCEVIIAEGAGCCGALVHHMGREAEAHVQAKANIAAWEKVATDDLGLDAIVINASGCGTTVKDYGWMLKDDPDWADRAETISALTCDVTEIMSELGLGDVIAQSRPTVTYHSACSMQHGQQIREQPKDLLRGAGAAAPLFFFFQDLAARCIACLYVIPPLE